jgi:(2S)-methylsuccinyl-CoA dehydrogenase
MSSDSPLPTLDGARELVEAAEGLLEQALGAARAITGNGVRIDDHQVLTERVAYAATETRAARELLEVVAEAESGAAGAALERCATLGVGTLVQAVVDRLSPALDDLGLGEEGLERAFPAARRVLLRRATNESALRALGRQAAQDRGRNDWPLDEMHSQVRDQVRDFATNEVEPHAERIHRHDELVPEEFISKMAELGFFGLSVPEEYGGVEMGNLAMILTTEELSRASLAAAGSLITRPEILTKALLNGGTEEQKREWLPRIASGEVMVGISVTEPDIEGWVIQGPKSWCTFAGRANVLALLARTDPDPTKAQKGLSLFIVPKEPFTGHEFEYEQSSGGKLSGKADATPGYRGMHSYTLQLENYFVPAENLVGGEAGQGRGFYLQMAGFAAGRLQTGGRACGLAQAALETTAKYVVDRAQFRRRSPALAPSRTQPRVPSTRTSAQPHRWPHRPSSSPATWPSR